MSTSSESEKTPDWEWIAKQRAEGEIQARLSAEKWEHEADAMRIGNGHLRDKLEQMTGWRNECGYRYNAEKEKTAKLRAALLDCLQMSPLNPFERGEMIKRVLAETQ